MNLEVIKPSPRMWHRGIKAVLALAGAVVLVGCRGDRSDDPPRQFLPDMDDQPKAKAQSKSAFFKDYSEGAGGHGEVDHYGRSMRQPPAHSVAFGRTSRLGAAGDGVWDGKDFADRAVMLAEDEDFYLGYRKVLDKSGKAVTDETGAPKLNYVEYIPIPVDDELLALGEKKFKIICIVCHGGLGDGQGLVGQRWNAPLPTWHDPKYLHGGEKGQDGLIFKTIREGVAYPGGPYDYKMRPYASKLSERESWAIVAYIRALQESRRGSMSDVPESQRELLMKDKKTDAPAASPKTGGGA